MTLDLADNSSCLVLGGSSLTTLSADLSIQKHNFYPKTLDEYINGIVDAALQYGKLHKNHRGVLVTALAGAVQREGELVGLTDNFRLVRDDAVQRGMNNLFFRQLVEDEFVNRGYEISVFGYNDTVPALSATMSQPNTEAILREFEQELGTSDRSRYALKYMINGTGTGEATLLPDSGKIITAEKGHLKPCYLWYRLNPLFRFVTRLSVVGQNRTVERTIAGGPNQRSARHFSKILNEIISVLKDKSHPEADGLSVVLGFQSHADLMASDVPGGLLAITPDEDQPSSLIQLGQAVSRNSRPALAIRNAFARALGSAMAFMHFAIGEMPDVPLHTFIGLNEVRESALGFIRSDGSTTALLSTDTESWAILNRGARDYADAVLGADNGHLFRILNINTAFPDIHPDFGGLPKLAEKKLAAVTAVGV